MHNNSQIGISQYTINNDLLTLVVKTEYLKNNIKEIWVLYEDKY